ncbi:hypothetical protein U1839_25880 [Sphingomonas sp. RT2P30]|uniref:hypothetical protein n=1 Tax=Parasphingomonas halimpatiens TaxID=3096162 RepID=UPI002FC8DF59
MEMIKNKPFSSYRLTRFFLLYVLSRLLSDDVTGNGILRDPSSIMGKEEWAHKLSSALDPIISSLLIDLNYEVDRAGDSFDYKSELKSPNRVRDRADELLKSYEKEVAKDKLGSFGARWQQLQ